MEDDFRDLLSPFRLFEDTTMYQGLPNVKVDKKRVKPTSTPSKPKKSSPSKKKPTRKK